MTKSTFTKTKAQMKSSSYYTFWGIATVAVVAGQIYVGTGYRSMSKSLDAWFDKTISIMIQKRLMGTPERGGVEFLHHPDERPRGTYEPIVPPPKGDFRDYPPGIVFLNES